MKRVHRLIFVALLLTGLAYPLALRFEAQAAGAIVISQVYGGGGNAGATLTHDFIELFNRGTAPVSVDGWSVQYASAAGSTWQVTSLSGTIPPGGYYLVQQAQGAGGTTALPLPDATGTIAMSATAGKVALASSTAALTGACPASVVDFAGYGTTANCFEGSGPAPGLNNTGAALRAGGGCTDANANGADFSTGAPAPRNSSSGANVCDGPTPLTIAATPSPGSVPQGEALTVTAAVTPATSPDSIGLTVTADLSAVGGSAEQPLFDDGAAPDGSAGDNIFTTAVIVPANNALGTASLSVSVTDAQARSATDTFPVTVVPPPVVYLPHHVQGSGAASPFPAGTPVTVQGVVTARKFNGFFIQTAPGQEDADPDSSEGLFVFTSAAAPAAAQVGRVVQVAGTVAEFISSADPGGPPLTELTGASVVDVGTGALPAPIALTATLVSPFGAFDQLERFEGMRVTVESLTAVSGTGGTKTESAATSTSNGTFYAVLTGTPRPFREAGIEVPATVPTCAAGSGCAIPIFDSNPERLRVDSDALEGLAPLDVSTGAVTGPMTGPLDYGGRAYTILPEATVAIVGGTTPTYAPAPGATQFTVASFNMERFFDTVNDPGGDTVLTLDALERRLSKASLVVRQALRTPDILAVQEVEHVALLTQIAERVNADRGLACPGDASCYAAILEEGNDPGGIDVGFLIQARVTILEATQWGKDATYTYPDPTPADPHQLGTALMNDRPSLSVRARLAGPLGRQAAEIIVVVNHLRSLNGIEDPGEAVRVRAKRQAQAEFLAGVLQGLQEARPTTPIISVGDYNAFEVNDGYVDVMGTVRGAPAPPIEVARASADLVGPNFADAASLLLPAPERYSYSFNGNAQTLDHVLVSTAALGLIPAAATLAGLAHARINADFPEILRTDPTRPERLSDHDPVVAYFDFPILAGKMLGAGTVGIGSNRTAFAFGVAASTTGEEQGFLLLQAGPLLRLDFLVAPDVPSVTFSARDTVSFAGTGSWQGRPGFTFEATASDRGEPGRNTDTFSIVVKNPSGRVVFSASGTLREGNIYITSIASP